MADAGDRVVGRGRNRLGETRGEGRELAGTRLAHAEVNALLDASAWEGDPRGLTLYTTVEPGPLCAGAIVRGTARRPRDRAEGAGRRVRAREQRTPRARGRGDRAAPAAARGGLGELPHRTGELRALGAAGARVEVAIGWLLALCAEAAPVH